MQEREDDLTRLVETRTTELQTANEAMEERARELTTLNEQLEQMSLVDGLTGVRNRRSFDASWDEEWRRALRLETPLSLLLMDLDHFKRYNDQYGHPAGDECLRRVAGVIGDALQRASDLVARYGGEEFVVILPTTPSGGAVDLAERIRTAVESLQLPHAGSSHRVVTISIGVATVVPRASTSSQQAIEAADAALYQAKRDGRNCVCVGSAF
jgi:diguanylate cyclase (GGDEF)-like protein